MKVLYLTYDGLTDPLGQSQILPYLTGLVAEGFSITIISFEKPENRNAKKSIELQLSEHQFQWHPLSYTKRPPVLSTLWDIYRLRKLVTKLHKNSPFDLVHCRSYITALVGLHLKRKKGIPFLFDMRGFWADERVDGNIWAFSNPLFRSIYRFFKKKEKQFFSESDHIISLTHAGKEIIKGRIVPTNHAPITVIPCCVDTEHFDSTKETNLSHLKNTHAIPDSAFILGYVGSIGTWYMLPEMLDFFCILLKEKPNAIFFFVTKEAPESILSICQEKGIPIDNIRIASAQRQEVPSYISLFDWSIFFIKPVFSKQASSPTKQGELMSMGVPIICNTSIGDTDQIVKEFNSGVLVNEFNDPSYMQAITEMNHYNKDSVLLREGSIKYFGLQEGIRTYSSVYSKCLEI